MRCNILIFDLYNQYREEYFFDIKKQALSIKNNACMVCTDMCRPLSDQSRVAK